MLKDLFVNTTILITFIFLGGQFSRSSSTLPISENLRKVLYGTVCGVLGAILIYFSIRVINGTFVDLRLVAIMISALYGGFLSAYSSALIISIFRLFYSGVSFSSVAAVINIMIAALACGLIARLNMKLMRKWFTMLVLCCVSFLATVLIILIKKETDYLQIVDVLLNLIAAFAVSGSIIYYVIEYIDKSNALFLQFKEQSTKDYLTGLNNIRQFDTELNHFTKRVVENREMLSLLLIDIDHFKRVNDTYGHAAGDAVLKQLGNVLISACRSFDSVSRNGGEEFSVLLPDCSHSRAIEVAERVRNAVLDTDFILPDMHKINITISVGVSSYPETTGNLDDLLRQADGALYKAKRSGRNKVCTSSECIFSM